MAAPVAYGSATRHWRSKQRFENLVRQFLVTYADAFENHMVGGSRSERLMPKMEETIPGQFNRSNHGIDIFAVDVTGRLWVIEISEGRLEGAARFKGGGADVAYAGGGKQMSADWRREATQRFLAQNPDAIPMLRDLLHLRTTPDAQVITHFNQLYAKHKPAIIVPEGAHFDTSGTDIQFTSQVYTIRIAGLS